LLTPKFFNILAPAQPIKCAHYRGPTVYNVTSAAGSTAQAAPLLCVHFIKGLGAKNAVCWLKWSVVRITVPNSQINKHGYSTL